ncbi:Methionine aminopeptidase [uncultured archaeon]|nr:Methionine aminopeptidase [uncultured archaeon]
MTEKQYGGKTGREGKTDTKPKTQVTTPKTMEKKDKKEKTTKETSSDMAHSFKKANEIAEEIREFTKKIVKKDIPLLEIAEKIEAEIIRLGGKPAFPTNLSINEIAAHYTPSYDDKTLARGLLKVDFGIQVNGWTSDNALSIDLENSEENKKLILTAEIALEKAIDLIKREKEKTSLSEIGKEIQTSIEKEGFKPVVNLSGHEIDLYDLHAGQTIPNVDNKTNAEIGKGIKAIEPFSTTGVGKVHDGNFSGIYSLIDGKTPRMLKAREVLEFIAEEYQTLPFCSRWIHKKFGSIGILALKQLEENGNLHHFAQLIESSRGKVAQAERTILID